jgi:hypothetical protein
VTRCRLVRQLYTDDEEVLFQAARPILLNVIEDVISRPDLADRAIFLTLPPIGDAQTSIGLEEARERSAGWQAAAASPRSPQASIVEVKRVKRQGRRGSAVERP